MESVIRPVPVVVWCADDEGLKETDFFFFFGMGFRCSGCLGKHLYMATDGGGELQASVGGLLLARDDGMH